MFFYLLNAPLVNAENYSQISDLKAAYFYNALKFTQWPSNKLSSNNNLTVLLIGSDTVCSTLSEKLPLYSILTHKLELKQLPSLKDRNWLANANDRQTLQQAHAIYFAEDTLADYRNIIDTLDQPVLTGSSIPGFAKDGGMIEITYQQKLQKLVFHINAGSLKKSGISINSQLMKLATIVDKPPRQSESTPPSRDDNE
jgi:hypothetical protein